MDRRRLGALAGIVGPPMFVAVFVVEGWLRPAYDSRGVLPTPLAQLSAHAWVHALFGSVQS